MVKVYERKMNRTFGWPYLAIFVASIFAQIFIFSQACAEVAKPIEKLKLIGSVIAYYIPPSVEYMVPVTKKKMETYSHHKILIQNRKNIKKIHSLVLQTIKNVDNSKKMKHSTIFYFRFIGAGSGLEKFYVDKDGHFEFYENWNFVDHPSYVPLKGVIQKKELDALVDLMETLKNNFDLKAQEQKLIESTDANCNWDEESIMSDVKYRCEKLKE